MNKKLVSLLVFIVLLGLTLTMFAIDQAVAEPIAVTPLPPVTDPDGKLGTCYGFYEDPPDSGTRPYLDLMFDAGARNDRWDFSWWAIQPDHQEQWNWQGQERIVRAETARGINVLGILQWTPQWASTAPQVYSGLTDRWRTQSSADARFYAHTHGPLAPDGPAPFNSYPPKNLDQPVFVSGQINPENYWGYYVYNVAQHFSATNDPTLRVDAWEIWNEVEGAYFWSGTAGDYCRLLQVAYQAIKGDGQASGGNPDATVLFAGLHYWANPTMYTEVLDCLYTADPGGVAHNYFFDVMSVHFYSRSDNTYDMVNLIRGQMDARGMGDHPIWLTETGAPLYGDAWPGVPYLNKGDNFLTIDQSAAYVIQSYANALAADVARYYFFRAHDADMGEPHGLIRNDHSLRPAYVAYQVVARYLRGENEATRTMTPEVTHVSLWGTPRGKISVLWNRTPTPVTHTLPAAMPTATLVDRWGVTQTLQAVNDVYALPLPVATANLLTYPDDYIVGGDPLILIETDTVSPTSRLDPLPARVQGNVVTLTWTADDADSGLWYTELQVSPTPDGPWTPFAGVDQTVGVTQTAYQSTRDGAHYFRARARDRVGNWEPWPTTFEVSTTLDLDVALYLNVGSFFTDVNRNGIWEPITGTGSLTNKFELTLTEVTMRLLDPDGGTITQTVGDGWHLTETLSLGRYTFVADGQDDAGQGWIRFVPITVDGSIDPLTVPLTPTLGLWPRYDLYLPLSLADIANLPAGVVED